MKKTLSASVLPVLCFITVLVLGCGGDDDKVTSASCDKAVNSYTAAVNAYIADPTDAKCQSLKATLNDLVSCPGVTAAQKKEYQDAVNVLC